jgi:hypothetical protein
MLSGGQKYFFRNLLDTSFEAVQLFLSASMVGSGLRSADIALQIEAAVIDALRIPLLTNQVRGWRSSRYGRTPLEELIALYRRHPVRIQEPSVAQRPKAFGGATSTAHVAP